MTSTLGIYKIVTDMSGWLRDQLAEEGYSEYTPHISVYQNVYDNTISVGVDFLIEPTIKTRDYKYDEIECSPYSTEVMIHPPRFTEKVFHPHKIRYQRDVQMIDIEHSEGRVLLPIIVEAFKQFMGG